MVVVALRKLSPVKPPAIQVPTARSVSRFPQKITQPRNQTQRKYRPMLRSMAEAGRSVKNTVSVPCNVMEYPICCAVEVFMTVSKIVPQFHVKPRYGSSTSMDAITVNRVYAAEAKTR